MFSHKSGPAGQSFMDNPAVFLQLQDDRIGCWFFKAVQKKVRVRETGIIAVCYGFGIGLQRLGNGPGKGSGICLFTQAAVGAFDQQHNQADMIAEGQPPYNLAALFRGTGW